MRLHTKIAIYATAIVSISLTLGFLIFYTAVRRTMERAAVDKLTQLNHVVQLRLAAGYDIAALQQEFSHVHIRPMSKTQEGLKRKTRTDATYKWNDAYQANLYHIVVVSWPVVHQQQYRIQSELFIPAIDGDFFIGLMMVIAWIFTFTIIANLFLGELISKSLYSPFYMLLEAMQGFDVRKKQVLSIARTKVKELRSVNQMVQNLTRQTIQHYTALEEFTENLTHEIQTPLANIKGKIELLINTDLSTAQLQQLSSMYDSVRRISSINQSLILLMSLEHHQPNAEPMRVKQMLQLAIAEQEEIIEMKMISIIMRGEESFMMHLNPILAPIVWNNLLSNAVRYNIIGGAIEIVIMENRVSIRNTGDTKPLDEDLIFSRFHRGNKKSESLGIGLALVRRILYAYGYAVRYRFDVDGHYFTIESEKH